MPTLCTVENMSITLELVLCIHGSESKDSTNCRPCSTTVVLIEKNLCISGPLQFKPMLFKGQLYIFLEKCLFRSFAHFKIGLSFSY